MHEILSSDTSRRSLHTDKLRKQGMEIRELFCQFLAEHPDIDMSEDMDLTLQQEQEWDAYCAPVLASHEAERRRLNESEY